MFLWMIFQILIESLPISSSGHVMLLERIYNLFGYDWPHEAMENINFLLHGPALIIMLCYFFNQWSVMILGKKFEFSDLVRLSSYQKIMRPFVFLIIADVITFLFWKSNFVDIFYIQKYFLPIGFFLTAVMLYLSKNIGAAWILESSSRKTREGKIFLDNEKQNDQYKDNEQSSCHSGPAVPGVVSCEAWDPESRDKKIGLFLRLPGSQIESGMTRENDNSSSLVNFSFFNAVILGTVQGLALLPGISRFACTFFASRVLGYNPKNSFAISFLIQLPLICAGFLKGVLETHDNFLIWNQIFNLPMLFAMVGISFVSYKIFCFVGTMIEQNKIWYFSLYMIIPIVLAILL